MNVGKPRNLRIATYDWSSWSGFLLPAIVPETWRIDARPGEGSPDVLARLSADTTHFAFHLGISLTSAFLRSRPDLIGALRERGVSVINGRVVDITKRHIQEVNARAGLPSCRATIDGPADEKVILKSNYNYGAEAERRLTVEDRRMLGLEDIPDAIENSLAYRVLRRGDVPPHSWRDASIVVERLVENPFDFFFRVYVAGDRLAISRVADPAILKKMPVGIQRETALFRRSRSEWTQLESPYRVPPSLVRTLGTFIAAFELDFGALDVVHELPDTYVVIDVNNTPHWGDGGHPRLLNFLRQGLLSGRFDRAY